MQRELKLYIIDILDAIRKIENYTSNITYNDFKEDELIQDGVARNLEIIGEAVKKIPDDVRNNYSQIAWKKIAGLRDILIHEYFGIDIDIIWDITKHKIPELRKVSGILLKKINESK